MVAIEMDDTTTLNTVPDLEMPKNPPSPVLPDVNGGKKSDLFVLGLNLNASVSPDEVMGNEEVEVLENPSSPALKDVNGENKSDLLLGLNLNASASPEEVTEEVAVGLKDSDYFFHVANDVEEGEKDDGFHGESDLERGKGIEDFRNALMDMDSEVGYPDSDADCREKSDFSVGDLVWGKIRSHPRWPGQIYAPDDASDAALKLKTNDRLLVAFFGDGSFSWCLPSQLIPFAENFEKMSKQTISRTFVQAKQNGARAFVKAIQEAVDAIGRLVELELTCSCVPDGNKTGLSRPVAVNNGIKSGVFVPKCDIGKLLSFRFDPSEVLMVVSSIAQSASFASSLELSILKGWLSAFYRARGGFTLPTYREPRFVPGLEDPVQRKKKENDWSVPIEVPLKGSLKEDWITPCSAGDKRKQKSEIGTDVMIPKRRKRVTKKSDSTARGKKPKDESLERNEEMQASEPDSPIDESKDYKEISSTRPRRKSRYLSAPFTSYDLVVAEYEEKAKFFGVGEWVKVATKQLFDSSPVSISRDDKMSKEIIEAVNDVESGIEMLSGLLSVACTHMHPQNSEMLELTTGFFSAFRSSMYLHGENFNLYHHKPLKIDENTGTKKRKEELSDSDTPKRLKAAAKEEVEGIKLEKHTFLASSLVLTVPPESSLPSKREIMEKFSEYGHVNEEETVVFSNFCRVKIEHENIDGAEAALRGLMQGHPFGSKTVDYKILYRSDAPPTAAASNLPSDGMPDSDSVDEREIVIGINAENMDSPEILM